MCFVFRCLISTVIWAISISYIAKQLWIHIINQCIGQCLFILHRNWIPVACPCLFVFVLTSKQPISKQSVPICICFKCAELCVVDMDKPGLGTWIRYVGNWFKDYCIVSISRVHVNDNCVRKWYWLQGQQKVIGNSATTLSTCIQKKTFNPFYCSN